MSRYAFCLGITLDRNCNEHVCQHRSSCAYYQEDLFARHPQAFGEGELIVNEPGCQCQWFMPTDNPNIVKKEEIDENDIFAVIKDLKQVN